MDSTGAPTATGNSSGIRCSGSTCLVTTVNAKENYIARSANGTDTDRIAIVPR